MARILGPSSGPGEKRPPVLRALAAGAGRRARAHAARKAAEQRGDAARTRDTRLGAAAEARLAWTALGRLFILNPYSVGVNSSNFIPAPDNVIVLLVTARQRAAGDKAGPERKSLQLQRQTPAV